MTGPAVRSAHAWVSVYTRGVTAEAGEGSKVLEDSGRINIPPVVSG